jgi:hypothetical protein
LQVLPAESSGRPAWPFLLGILSDPMVDLRGCMLD